MKKAKKVLSIALCLCLTIALLPTMALAAGYTDTSGHWAKDHIDRWSGYNVVNGLNNNEFAPNGNMTRAQAAQVFMKLLKLTKLSDISQFTDVDPDAWYADALAACVEAGIMNGVGNDQMNPGGTITREMLFVMFARALGIPQEDTLDTSFSDSDSISSWARGSVFALINNGYVSGTSENTLAPLNDINRASVMALLDKSISAYAVEDGAEVEASSDGIVLVLADNVTITGDADVTIIIPSEGVTVSLEGYTGNATIIVTNNNVSVTNAPAGTVVMASDNVTGTTANGNDVSAGKEITIPEKQTSVPFYPTPTPDPTPETQTPPKIIVNGRTYIWDADKQEYYFMDAEEKEYVSPGQLIDDMEESSVIIFDGKEYFFDNGEWYDDAEEVVSFEEIIGGTNIFEGID